MKIEQLLVKHLYEFKEVTLQGIGTFTIKPDIVFPSENEKDFMIPPGGISFTYNPKATEDEALITSIVRQTRKIRPLASADLDSYVVLGRQFINIGKPFIIEGIGTLHKNQSGQYELELGSFISQKIEAAPGALKEKNEEAISFASENPRKGNKKALLIIASIGLLALAGWGGWYLLKNKKNITTTENRREPQLPVTDTLAKAKSIIADSINSPANAVTPSSFKIVFRITPNRAAAEKIMNTLISRGHKVIMYTADSIIYKLAEPYNLPLADTTHVRDSLNRFYYVGKAHVEL
jgi:hypothetical protein